jgi:lysophospholipase L1-like esterase
MNDSARTFMLVSLVVLILLVLHQLPRLTVGDVELRRVNVLSDLFPEITPHDDEAHNQMPRLTEWCQSVTTDVHASDSIVPADSIRMTDTAGDFAAERTDSIVHIEDYSQGEPGGMAHFYSQLRNIGILDRPIRIAYYGDSFVEGDILTADLREMLQTAYGGSGVGWVDCGSEIAGFRQTVRLSFSGLTEYEVVKKPYHHRAEGISQRYFVPDETARVTLKGSRARKHLSQWQRSTLYLRTEGGVVVQSDTIVERLSGSADLQTVSLRADTMKSVTFRFSEPTDETWLYGVALESDQGIILDNFSMRGSSGTTLADIPQSTLQAFARVRPYDLVVFHFGLNVANPQSHASTYKGYTKQMGRVISHFREAWPEASILIVSMPDRDQRSEAGIRTMTGVEQLVAYQQMMAAEQRVAFFNLFQSMGGRESMKGLVDRGLANKDYTHLTFSGGREIAKGLVRELIIDN